MTKLWLLLLVSFAWVGLPASPLGAAPANPGDSRNCGDFPGWNEAQVWYETYFPNYGDVGRLDADHDGIPCEANQGSPQDSPPARGQDGYLMLERSGTVFGFGGLWAIKPVILDRSVAVSLTPGRGYRVLTPDGRVHTRGAAAFGNAAVVAGDEASSIAGLPDDSGYWIFTKRGAAFAFGGAQHVGDMSATPLNGRIVAATSTPSGKGYWMVGSDGGIFSFGDARFFGSTGDIHLNAPVVGIVPDPDGVGYWLVAADGGIFAFDAPYRGSLPGTLPAGQRLARPVIGAVSYGDGYLMVASDGGIFNFSNKAFAGSLGSTPPPNPIVGVAATGAATA